MEAINVYICMNSALPTAVYVLNCILNLQFSVKKIIMLLMHIEHNRNIKFQHKVHIKLERERENSFTETMYFVLKLFGELGRKWRLMVKRKGLFICPKGQRPTLRYR
jgi:hypothetical protein